jgi:hypothetical protein
MANRPGWARCTSTASWRHGGTWKGGDEDRAVDADFVHRRHHRHP